MKTHSTLLLLTFLLGVAAPASAEVLFRGDFETGTTNQWKSTPKAEGIKVVTDPVLIAV